MHPRKRCDARCPKQMLPNIHKRDAGKQSLDGGITVSPETGNDDHVAAVDGDIGSALRDDNDIDDRILTLPAAIAIRNPKTATMFCYPDQRKREEPGPALQAALREAEQVLDELAAQACHEAAENGPRPKDLIALVHYTRGLSRG